MGINNRLRRAAKKRDRARRAAPGGATAHEHHRDDHGCSTYEFPGQVPDQAEQASVLETIDRALLLIATSSPLADAAVFAVRDLSARARSLRLDPAPLVAQELLQTLAKNWERGWQPVETVHVMRRRVSVPAADLVALAITREADRSRAADRAPQEWLDQLAALDIQDDGADLIAGRGRAGIREWTAALSVLSMLRRLMVIEALLPKPSQWDRIRSTSTTPRTPRRPSSDPKVVTRIRSLLAKAESTEFAAEAEAFTGKAQDLMTRHAIDEAMLHAGAGDDITVLGRRVLIDNPYPMEKVSLLNQVAEANRVRAVWNEFACSVTIVGVPTDLEQVEMLFTSLLIQATRAMTEAGRNTGANSINRSSSFRRAFLAAYATRIGQRLTQASEGAAASYGSALVPVLARQQQAVSDAYQRMFPRVKQRGRSRMLDRRGWQAGTAAADRAVLTRGQVDRGA